MNAAEIKVSPLSKRVERDGAFVDIEIFDDGAGGWLLEIVDQFNNSTVWDDVFTSESAAFNEAMNAIDQEGIDAFIG